MFIKSCLSQLCYHMPEEQDSQLGIRDEDNDEHHQEPSNVFSALTDNKWKKVSEMTIEIYYIVCSFNN